MSPVSFDEKIAAMLCGAGVVGIAYYFDPQSAYNLAQMYLVGLFGIVGFKVK